MSHPSTRGRALRLALIAGLIASFALHGSGQAAAPRVLFDFETGTAGWTAGQNVDKVVVTSSTANQPGTTFHGGQVLQASTGTCTPPCANPAWTSTMTPASAPHTISWQGPALKLVKAKTLTLGFNSYGFVAPVLDESFVYVVTVTLQSKQSSLTKIYTEAHPNRWNRVVVDMSRWAGRAAVNQITVSLKVPDQPTPWAAAFQIDYLTSQ